MCGLKLLRLTLEVLLNGCLLVKIGEHCIYEPLGVLHRGEFSPKAIPEKIVDRIEINRRASCWDQLTLGIESNLVVELQCRRCGHCIFVTFVCTLPTVQGGCFLLPCDSKEFACVLVNFKILKHLLKGRAFVRAVFLGQLIRVKSALSV